MRDPQEPRRKPLHLSRYDYASWGHYFVTACARGRRHTFGAVHSGKMQLSAAGRCVWSAWRGLAQKFPSVDLDAFVVMPDHVHGLLHLGQGGDPGDVTPSLHDVMRVFKSVSAFEIHRLLGQPGKVWQRRYYDDVVCGTDALNRIRRYIRNNPANWTR